MQNETKPAVDSLPVFHITEHYDPLTPSKKHGVLLGLLQFALRELAKLPPQDPADPAVLFTLPIEKPEGEKPAD